jgi:2-oxo-3-hexenedioate decarboxylase
MPTVSDDERISKGMETQLAGRSRRLDEGERALGWKLGFGTSAAMEKLGIDGPLVGYLLESGRLESGATAALAGWGNPKLEPEIAAHIGPGGSIAALGAAIELVDLDADEGDPEAILAAGIYQRHVLLGPPAANAETTGVALQLLVNGEEVAATGDVTELTGEPAGLVAHVAATLARSGAELREGDVVICGSIVPAISVAAGDEVELRLEPLGRLAVAFE